ncbi:hypothetical protein CMI42_06230 [Candidatus Pacearchaeota archaeon]|nr:hypothetical protein [Candidatus Pacearchaeota archaeon]|tara:strand:- start:292 stop:885 length:594 start_codon:yes stop_codon:yes gene_type:complete
MILIIDNESSFIKYFQKDLEKASINFKVIKAEEDIDLDNFENIQGIILTGGRGTPLDRDLINDYKAIDYFNVPIIGFCIGHEAIADHFRGEISHLDEHQDKMEEIHILERDSLLEGVGDKIFLREKHYANVSKLPEEFKLLASSKVCPIEIMKHKLRPIYGFQSHPERSPGDGDIIMNNFLKICGIDKRVEISGAEK